MNSIKRSSIPPAIDGRSNSSGSQLPMGNDETISCYGRSSRYTSEKSTSRSSSPMERKRISALTGWMLPIAYGCVVLSWLGAIKDHNSLSQISLGLDVEKSAVASQGEESLKKLTEAKGSKFNLERRIKKLKRTQELIKHEVRVSEEMIEVHYAKKDPELRELLENRKSGVVMNWIQQRQEGLRLKMLSLQRFIQDDSRKQVIGKYGEGPYRVRFSVRYHKSDDIDEFVLEMADLEFMPHSVLFFLDMVHARLWDNTVFYHHAQSNHVLAAAPVVFGTFEPKHHHLQALGFSSASFAEYSDAFPHEEFTVGFNGRGPNFYINTRDNSRHHGPGGQDHHDLPGDADPCFAKVISGHANVKGMLTGNHSPNKQLGVVPGNPVLGSDYDMTQIVKAEII
jgi:hypothetical protein